MAVGFQVQLKIRKPIEEVFDAVVNPAKLSGYFISQSIGPLVPGTVVSWTFPEFEGGGSPVTVDEVVPCERIVLRWIAADGDYLTRVEMAFATLDDGSTMVSIAESGWRETDEGRAASYDNAGGWMHMMCCMKGYLEYGINLREGGAL